MVRFYHFQHRLGWSVACKLEILYFLHSVRMAGFPAARQH